MAEAPPPFLVPLDANLSSYAGFVPLGSGREAWVEASGLGELGKRRQPSGGGGGGGGGVGGGSEVAVGGCEARALLAAAPRAAARLESARRSAASSGAFLRELSAALRAAEREVQSSGGSGGGGAFNAASAAAEASARVPRAQALAALAVELRAAGFAHLASISADLRSLELRVHDTAGREHTVLADLPAGYGCEGAGGMGGGGSSFACVMDLPGMPSVAAAGLQAALEECRRRADEHGALLAELDALDAGCAVLEPPAPAPRAATHRRLALGRHASLLLRLRPEAPRAPPAEAVWFGAEATIQKPREALASACAPGGAWNAACSVLENLRTIVAPLLELKAPAGADGGSQAADGDGAECGICYSYLLPEDDEDGDGRGGAAPSRACGGCGMPFHARCLREWLQSDAAARQSFRTLFGACPFCSAELAVDMDAE